MIRIKGWSSHKVRKTLRAASKKSMFIIKEPYLIDFVL